MDKDTINDTINKDIIDNYNPDNLSRTINLASTIEDLEDTMKILDNLIKEVGELKYDYYKSKRLLHKSISMMILMFLLNMILLIYLIINLKITNPVFIVVSIVISLIILFNIGIIINDKFK